MAIPSKMVLLLSILIINVESLNPRNAPVSPCCSPSFLTHLFSYSPCACPPLSTTMPPKVPAVKYQEPKCAHFRCFPQSTGPSLFSSETLQNALKPVGIFTGASNLALGTILKIGGGTFKLVGTLTEIAGGIGERIGYDLKTTGSVKIVEGVQSIADFIQQLRAPSSFICVVEGNSAKIYELVDEKKKIEKVDEKKTIEKVDEKKKIEKVDKTTVAASYHTTATPITATTKPIYHPPTKIITTIDPYSAINSYSDSDPADSDSSSDE